MGSIPTVAMLPFRTPCTMGVCGQTQWGTTILAGSLAHLHVVNIVCCMLHLVFSLMSQRVDESELVSSSQTVKPGLMLRLKDSPACVRFSDTMTTSSDVDGHDGSDPTPSNVGRPCSPLFDCGPQTRL